MAKKEQGTDRVEDRDRDRWMARFQVRLAMQPGVDRAVVLRAVKETAGHCAMTGEDPRTAFGDPDSYAVEVAARLVPADRAARERRRDTLVNTIDSAVKKTREATGL
ncbi:hypothetical protein ACIRQY_17755 [Streptomyces sp. NPDC101490]|uniref:hypothetical protein n=1 Tax=Streptomyces sp. NPDC101490 TaxID=3366143 RepID=UPI00382BE20B